MNLARPSDVGKRNEADPRRRAHAQIEQDVVQGEGSSAIDVRGVGLHDRVDGDLRALHPEADEERPDRQRARPRGEDEGRLTRGSPDEAGDDPPPGGDLLVGDRREDDGDELPGDHRPAERAEVGEAGVGVGRLGEEVP